MKWLYNKLNKVKFIQVMLYTDVCAKVLVKYYLFKASYIKNWMQMTFLLCFLLSKLKCPKLPLREVEGRGVGERTNNASPIGHWLPHPPRAKRGTRKGKNGSFAEFKQQWGVREFLRNHQNAGPHDTETSLTDLSSLWCLRGNSVVISKICLNARATRCPPVN